MQNNRIYHLNMLPRTEPIQCTLILHLAFLAIQLILGPTFIVLYSNSNTNYMCFNGNQSFTEACDNKDNMEYETRIVTFPLLLYS